MSIVKIEGDRELGRKAVSAYVDLVSKKSLVQILRKLKLHRILGGKISLVGEGCYGKVYKLKFDKNYAFKVGRKKNAVEEKEYEALQMLSGSGVSPAPVAYCAFNDPTTYSNPVGAILMEYISGATLFELMKKKFNKPSLSAVEDSLVDLVEKMDERGFVLPFDFHYGNVILDKKGKELKAFIVDLADVKPYSHYKDDKTAKEINQLRLEGLMKQLRHRNQLRY